jgi:acetyltransferase-like isoleucine patch superfamily enzyme
MSNLRIAIQIAAFLLPWPIRRSILKSALKYNIAETARIGYSIILSRNVQMGNKAKIGHFNRIGGLNDFIMEDHTSIGNLNWVSGMPYKHERYFSEDKERYSALIMHEHSAVTHRHWIDCTDKVTIGAFSTIAGWRSQFLSHSIDIREGRQKSGPVSIGKYCFVGTGCIALKGTVLPDYSVLSAGSVLHKPWAETHHVYCGNPAAPIKKLPEDCVYFKRSIGHVY